MAKNKSGLSSQIIKQIKSHKAYNYNVYREAEANVTLIDNGDGTFTIDDWGTEHSGYGDYLSTVKLENISLKDALTHLLRANLQADQDDTWSVTWNMKGL